MKRFEVRVIIRSFLRDTSGVTAVEYALIAGGISLMVITGAALIGSGLDGIFTSTAEGF